MKKIIVLICLLLSLTTLSSCTKENSEKVTIIVPNGIPYMAISGLLLEDTVSIEVVSGVANLQTALANGSYDIVIAPINLGVNLYNNENSKYQVSHILTSNNAYIVTRSENKLDSIKDIENESVLGFGQTGIPANILKKLYTDNNFDVNNIDFKYSSSSEVYSVFAGGNTESKYALMSEPEISKLVLNDKINVKTLDLCDSLGEDVAQACVFVNPLSNKQQKIDKVLELIKENVKSLNANPSGYAEKIITLDRRFESMGYDVIVRSIPLTNIVFKKASENKEDITSILNILNIGLPDEKFYKK